MMILRPAVGLFMIFILNQSVAQYHLTENSLEDPAEWYDDQVGLQNTVLQNGELVVLERKSKKTHAYYQEASWVNTDITYYGQHFKNVQALYDLEQDILIIKNNLGLAYAPIRLTNEYVSQFSMGTSNFVFISDQVEWRPPGFYKMIHQGETIELISKVFKKLEIKDGQPAYQQNHHYFLIKDGKNYPLKRLGTLTKLYPEHKKAIRRHKRSLSIRNIDHPKYEDKLTQLIAYCDNLL